MTAKILTLDIETSPNLADVWGLWNQNIGLNQLHETGKVIAFAAKWHGQPKVMFFSDHHDGHEEMIDQAWALLDEADIVVHYNGLTFDMPHLRREFLLAGKTPPSPWQDVDLLVTVKKRFRFASNKLDHITRQLGLTGKVSTGGHELWTGCMAGDPKAWALMKRYNKQDVVITEQLYDKLRGWAKVHPHMGLYSDKPDALACPRCDGTGVRKKGFKHLPTATYQQYQCLNTECGHWFRDSRANLRVSTRSAE